jgi:DNA-binding NarL/FixJ family response regulator
MAVGLTADGSAALAAVQRLRPDVVLLGVRLPGLDGFTVAEQLVALQKSLLVVLMPGRDAAAYGPRIDRSRACRFLVNGICRVHRWPRWLGERSRSRCRVRAAAA